MLDLEGKIKLYLGMLEESMQSLEKALYIAHRRAKAILQMPEADRTQNIESLIQSLDVIELLHQVRNNIFFWIYFFPPKKKKKDLYFDKGNKVILDSIDHSTLSLYYPYSDRECNGSLWTFLHSAAFLYLFFGNFRVLSIRQHSFQPY